MDEVSDELDTANNCSSAASVTVGAAPAPDLVVGPLNLGGSIPLAGKSFLLNGGAENQGDAPSASTTLRYYLSTDTTITTSDTEIGTASVNPLGPSGGYRAGIRPTVPSTPGTYYYGACVDSVSGELDTTNNCSTVLEVVVGAAPVPDLVVDASTVSDSAPDSGASFTLYATVRNQGNGSSTFTTLRYYRSTDSTITTGDADVGMDSVSGLNSSGSSDESISLTAPPTPGTYYYGACVDSATGESDTTNNCSVAVTVSVGAAPAPDLVVDTPTVDASAPAAGARFTLNATVRNQGNGSSPFTTLRYFRSTDSTITSSDTSVGTDFVSRLDASESGDESISLTAPSTPGTYYYGACVDVVTGESDTTNNCSVAVTVTVGAAPAPDLVVDAPTVDASAPAAGARFTLNAKVRNQGNGRSDSATLRYYQSSDSTITTGDTEVGTDYVFRLDASESGDESVSLTAPSTPGTYYYGACVDSVSDELDSQNNCSLAVTVTVGAAPAPDLVVDAPTVDASAPAAGARFTLNAKVRNQGNGSSAVTTLRYFRSTDSTITSSDTSVGTDSVSRLDASESGDESISLTAPSTPGTYYYGACVDSLSDESDTTEQLLVRGDRNSWRRACTRPRSGHAHGGQRALRPAGARFTLNAKVRNQGNGPSAYASTTLRYYRSTESTITTGDTEVGTDSVSRLDASESGDESIILTAPSTPGTYYYSACVDSVTGESDTMNNCSPAVTVTVGAAPAPDLVVDPPTVSDSAPDAGASFTLSTTVRNQGNGSSTFTTLRYYRSTDSTITTGDADVGMDSVSGLNSYGSSDESISLTAPSTPGTYYYGACVDSLSDELDTQNNCSAAVTVTVGAAPAPDLVVDTPTVSNSSPTAGASFTLYATFRNEGNGSSSATTLRYYHSTDSTITTGDTEVGTDSISGLASSGSGDRRPSLTAPSTPGTYYYGTCMDSVTGESDITNNCSAAVTVTVGASATAPDLVVDTPTVSNSSPFAETSFTLNATVRNQGSGASAATRLRYYISTDSTITTSDTMFATDSVITLSSSSFSDESIIPFAPSTPGTYYYGACVDSVTGESDETNNCSAAVTVAVRDSASLTAPGVPTGLTATANGQTKIDLSWNAPTSDGGTAITGYRIEVSTNGSSWGDQVTNTGSTSTRYSHTDLMAGSTRHYRVFAHNSVGTSAASNVDNATTDAATAPDLVVDPPTVSDSAPDVGASFTLSTTVRNEGNGSSTLTTLRYYRSTDSTITSSDTSVGTDSISELSSSGSSDESISLTTPLTPGTYYYGACVDSVTGESDTTNNCSVAVTVTVGAAPAPDLVVDPPTVSESAPASGDRFTLNATVRNRGKWPFGLDHVALLPLHRLDDHHWRHGGRHGLRRWSECCREQR